ncbi:MAG: response regulator [Treponema sp.]|jgi:signal transduction histidine kinase/CheY-like chemotaxis protein|nr:response regulator [Treponema sp.]
MEKTKTALAHYAQALVVLVVFALMVISSYLFVSDTEYRHLKKNAESAILYTEANIKSDMLELETLLGVTSETINVMLARGDDSYSINEYILLINKYVEANDKRLYGATGIFGVFDVFNGAMLIGFESWIPPENYYQTERPWYTGAIKAAGEISTTEPYLNAYSNKITITLSRQIFDGNGNAHGIICLNIELDRIVQYVINTQFVEGGYGFLLSENYLIIAHPNHDMVGMPFRSVNSEIVSYMDELLENGRISQAVTHDYRGIHVILFMERLKNGWYMGIVTPRNSYYQSTRDLALILSVLGAIFAALLIWMLLRVTAEKLKADERVQIMSNSTPLCATFLDKNFNVTDCNQESVKLFELSDKKEYIEKFHSLSPRYQPDGSLSRNKSVEYVQKALDEGYCRFEWTHQKLNGEPIPCEITLIRVKYKKEFIIVAYTRDLRELKKMVKEIQQHSRLLDTVNNAAAVLLANNDESSFENSLLKSFDLVGNCLDVDRVQIWRNEEIDGDLHFVLRYEWVSDSGCENKQIPIGLHFPYALKREWEDQFLRGEYINAPLSELSEEDRAFLGYYGMKSIVIIPMFLDGNFWGFFSIDDCRRERAFSVEEISILTSAGLMMSSAVNRNMQIIKMREADERTQVMFDSAPFGASFWDEELNIIDCNKEMEKLFEVSDRREIIENFYKFSPEYQPDGSLSREKIYEKMKIVMDEGYNRFEWVHQKLNGEPIQSEVILIRVKHRGNYIVTAYIRDLREQKAMLREMRKAEIAEESSKAKSDFLAKMSHEIRTPMNAILGITEIQLQDNTLPQVTREALDRISNSGELLLGIINDILDLSKIESGKFELLPLQYDISSLVYDTVQLNIMRYESKPIEFDLFISENMPLMMIGDELRIKQIINNLLSNAFKYTQAGRVSLSIHCEDEGGDRVTLVFTISDTGQGMTAEQVKRLGSQYARFNLEANRKTEGTGLGMNITMNLIQMMGGDIDIDSTPGMGSTFTVRLPQRCTDHEPIGKELAENMKQLNLDNTMKIKSVQMKREFMPYGRVLVVDDVETNLYVAKGLLAPYGLSIDTALSGFEALDKIREGVVYDIIFMDHMMPRMDGIETTKIIRGMGYSNPIVALTANALAGQAEMFLNNGFDEFISKPIDIRELNLTLNKMIRDKYPPEVVEAARQQKDILYNRGSQSLDPQLAEFFLRDAKKSVKVLEAIYVNKCRRSDDISMFIINIHALKSALANVGETDLSAEAARLEQAGRDQNLKFILVELPSFLELLYAVIHKLEEKNEEENKTPPEDDDINLLKEKLQNIRSACAVYGKKAAKDALAELREKSWSPSVKEKLSAIAENLLHSEFDEAAKVIEDWVQRL